DSDPSLARLPVGLEHERGVAVAARRLAVTMWGNAPKPMVGAAKQRGETSIGIEPRKATPVDRAVAVDQRRRLQIGEKSVVLDTATHCAGEAGGWSVTSSWGFHMTSHRCPSRSRK